MYVQKKGTTHCAVIAVYNLLILYGKNWLPFRLVKWLMKCDWDTEDHRISTGMIGGKGTLQHDTVRVAKWFWRDSYSRHNPSFEDVKEYLSNGWSLILGYCPQIDSTHRHSIAITPWNGNGGEYFSGAIMLNHTAGLGVHGYDWDQFELAWQHIEFNTREIHKQHVSVIILPVKAKRSIYLKAKNELVTGIILKKAA